MHIRRNKRTPETEAVSSEYAGLLKHLVELRRRLLISVATVTGVFLVLVPFDGRLFAALSAPLLARLPPGSQMVAIHVASPFLTPLKFALVVAFFVSVPMLLYQTWGFVAPALYRRERKATLLLLVASTGLFYLGMFFAYFAVFPLMFRFFVHAVPANVKIMADISSYLGFVTRVLTAFGIAFEIPVAVALLTWTGVANARWFKRQRPYVLIGCFAVGAFFAPPDVFSQFLLAVPMYVLYELGIVLSAYLSRSSRLSEAPSESR